MHLQSLKNVYIDINKRFVHLKDKKEGGRGGMEREKRSENRGGRGEKRRGRWDGGKAISVERIKTSS